VTNNHGFADGNKRTALILVDMLITRSGYELVAADDGGDLETEIEDMILAVEAGMPFDDIVEWFKAHIRKTE